MEYRVGDKVIDLSHGAHAVVTSVTDGNRYRIKHTDMTGFVPSSTRSTNDLSLVKYGKTFGLGDKVTLRHRLPFVQERWVNIITTTEEQNGEITAVIVNGHGRFSPRELKMVERKGTGPIRKELPITKPPVDDGILVRAMRDEEFERTVRERMEQKARLLKKARMRQEEIAERNREEEYGYDIDDYAQTIQSIRKERDGMGAELYGYPSDDDMERMKRAEEGGKMQNEIAELRKENERLRRAKVAEDFGIVEERHIWGATIDVPMFWVGPIPKRGGEHIVEVLTADANMVEAAMAAEAMAKGIHENAKVTQLEYKRKLAAIR